MIRELPDTTTSRINAELTRLRAQGGAVTLGRVLTLVVVAEAGGTEPAIVAANEASNEHPCRVLVVERSRGVRGTARLDAEIRVGGDAGASEVVVLRPQGAMSPHPESVVLPLLLPDTPVVTWWPTRAPEVPSEDALGALARRRITDAAAARQPVAELAKRAAGYAPGDTDLAWTRLTRWRGLLAAALEQPPQERVTRAVVSGERSSASTELLAMWLRHALQVEVVRERSAGPGLTSVVLERASGAISLTRPDGKVATLLQPGQPDRHVALVRRSLRESLTEELRRLDPDEVYGEVLTQSPVRPPARGRAAAGSGRPR